MIKLSHFIEDDFGAITVDWVALTAGILLVGIMTIYAIYGGDGMDNILTNIEDTLLEINQSTTLAAVVISGGSSVNPN